MQVFLEGVIEMSSKKTFKDRETGEDKISYKNYVSDESGEIVEFNSKIDFSSSLRQNGVLTLNVYPQRESSGFWLSIAKFTPQDLEVEPTKE